MKAPEPQSLAEEIASLDPEQRTRVLASFGPEFLELVRYVWGVWERRRQREPDLPWRIWLVLAGRGFGKTRMGAEWVRRMAQSNPMARIALVGATMTEARAVMVEGDSGILAVCPPDERPVWEPSLGRLRWPGGARATVFSAAEPESLRGPQHHYAWCDEIAKWPLGPAAWDNLMLGLRCGALPRAMATTTPRPVTLVRRLCAQDGVAKTRGRTSDNAINLAGAFLADVEREYGGTRLGRQELDGELIEDVEGSLWPRDLIERCRAFHPPHAVHGEGDHPKGDGGVEGAEAGGSRGNREDGCQLPLHHASHGPPPHLAMRRIFKRIVIGVDPPVSAEGDACGIVVCGLGADGIGYVLADASVRGLSPEGWARAVASAAETWSADRVVAEGNQGGALVTSVLRGADVGLPVTMVHASIGKSARAEPVAALFERGAAKFAGAFPELEDELAGLIVGGRYEGPGRSPDRADAMVWAMTELMLGKRRAEPRIRSL
ncbi:MAG TPA: terminase family protein [Allosphingosinicella sp.]|nr:terminase family protein [Allosphingosinicella sp.]